MSDLEYATKMALFDCLFDAEAKADEFMSAGKEDLAWAFADRADELARQLKRDYGVNPLEVLRGTH